MSRKDIYSDTLDDINELVESIDSGMEAEFFLYGKRYCSCWDEKGYFIALCPDGGADGQYFKDGADIVNNWLVDGKYLKDVWQDIVIESI